MHRICAYDFTTQTNFQTGPIAVGGLLFGTTDVDTVALDPATCAQVWRVTETYEAGWPVNRGAAYLDGRLFRGMQDGRVLAYDAATGKRLWQRTIADPKRGELVSAAPIAWQELVLIGTAGGDNKGVKGRIYALDAATGEVRWEFYLVPKGPHDPMRGPEAPSTPELKLEMTRSWGHQEGVPVSGGGTWSSVSLDLASGLAYVPGGNPAPDFVPELRRGANLFANSVVVLDARTGAYKRHMPMTLRDFHDWDVSASPALFTSRAGRKLVATAGKDGHLYVNDRDTGRQLLRTPVTTIENAEAPLTVQGTHFCPGTQGGTQWNGPAYSPATNLIYTGAVDWCSTVRTMTPEEVKKVAPGKSLSGADGSPFGTIDPREGWAGWIYAIDADTWQTRWKYKMAAPVLGGVTPTAGGLLFAGDIAGNFVALDAASGRPLWSVRLVGAIGGGIISYEAEGKQRIAVADGMVSSLWPAAKVSSKLIVFGID